MIVKKKKKRKIALITGSRGEYGYIRPVIREIEKRENLDYGLIVTNMHLLDAFGMSVKEIHKDKIKIFSTVNNTFDGYNRVSMVKSLAVFQLQLPDILEQMEADILLVAGDRGEQLVGALTGAHMYLPVAHIQAGEVSGNIDGITRHAITKYAHIHFASNQDAAERVLKMGEEKHRVYNVGAPQLDELISGHFISRDETYKKFNLKKNSPIILFVFHPITEEVGSLEKYMDQILQPIISLGYQTIIILNNSDAGGNIVRRKILENKKPFMKIYSNVSRQEYLGLLNTVDFIIGNSSSGILEAPTFHLPAINIGNRQNGRMQAMNVVNTSYDSKEIKQAIKKVLSLAFKKKMKNCVNLYGDGQSSKRIVDVLEQIKIDSSLLIKRITY